MSAKKPHGLTTLEMQAQNIVKEEDDEVVYINDTEKYNAMVESRKERRAVSISLLELLVQGQIFDIDQAFFLTFEF